MNCIRMYASSTHLRNGLHRALAVSHALTEPLRPGEPVAWWEDLGLPVDAREHRLSLEALAEVYQDPKVRATLDALRGKLSLPALDHDEVQRAFRAAIISGRAHRAHGGRDVYGTSNKHLWDMVCSDLGLAVRDRWGASLGDDPVARVDSEPSPSTLDALKTLTRFDTSPKGEDHRTCVTWLRDRLEELGFQVEVVGTELGQPLIVARRGPRGLEGHVVLYGHYDVTPFGRVQRWSHPPRQLTLSEGRLFARGVADNKGPLACRLATLSGLEETPAITWLIQGEEETGSTVAHALLPAIMGELNPTLWMDETGYHDHESGALRLLGRTMGEADASQPPDTELDELLRALRALASRWGVAARHEPRGLNKDVVAGGCPFNRNLPTGARYLAIGVNDSSAKIHSLNESVPAWTFPLHAAQLDLVFRWASAAEGAMP